MAGCNRHKVSAITWNTGAWHENTLVSNTFLLTHTHTHTACISFTDTNQMPDYELRCCPISFPVSKRLTVISAADWGWHRDAVDLHWPTVCFSASVWCSDMRACFISPGLCLSNSATLTASQWALEANHTQTHILYAQHDTYVQRLSCLDMLAVISVTSYYTQHTQQLSKRVL